MIEETIFCFQKETKFKFKSNIPKKFSSSGKFYEIPDFEE